MRQVVVLIAVLLVALVFNSLLPKSNGQQLDRPTIEKFIIEDAKVNYGDSAQYKISRFEQTDGKWNVILDISFRYTPQPGSNAYCTRTMRRYYSLFPILWREELWSNNC